MSAPVSRPLKPPFGAPCLAQLTGLVFELASQLHVERARRIALESALEAAGLLGSGAVDLFGSEPAHRARSAEALDRAMNGLMRVLTEDADPKTPLRAQAAAAPQPET